jgi:pimeloyl-ACP methyl ester carboxylesterase
MTRTALITVAAPIFVLAVVFGALFALSSGKPSPIADEHGHPLANSISEKIWININGVRQGMFIRGKDQFKPVLLFVHGGAGMPEYFLFRKYATRLEDYFVVCWWDRRGAGLSYSADILPQTMTTEQMILDTLAVTNYLRDRFRKEKIYLMAHSGGTFFAIQAVARYPELYDSYIAVAQMAYQLKSENVAYQYMLGRFKQDGNSAMVRKLEAVPPIVSAPLPVSYMALRDEAMHSLGIGTTRQMKSVITGVFLPSLLCRDYTLTEKINIWRGKVFSDKLLWDTMITKDLTKSVTSVAIPVYFIHGAHDYTVSFAETKAYFEALKAPVKGFYVFRDSAHSPMFEEPEKFHKIIEQDILSGANRFADWI